MRRIIYKDSKNRTCIVHPVINTFGDGPEFTERDAELRAFDKLPSDAIDPHYVELSDLPTDRTFRDAWKMDLSINMVKAREIHKESLRKLREPLLTAVDIERFKAFSDPVRMEELNAKAQSLRDVTIDPSIGEAKTPEDLKKAVPEVLKEQIK